MSFASRPLKKSFVKVVDAQLDPTWPQPPEQLTLSSDAVHVWRASLEQESSQLDRFQSTLAADERSRAGQFHFQRDRERFIVARGILRAILGRYLGKPPESLSFSYSSHGKPALVHEPQAEAIRFNLSHSHGLALYAVTRGREIGVDLELIREGLAIEQIAERFFSRQEFLALCALPPELRRRAFFLGWTRKEAYIKARGEGLSLPLDQFDVSLTPGEPAMLLNTRPDSEEALRWSLQELAPSSSYAAALAVEGNGSALSYWRWQ